MYNNICYVRTPCQLGWKHIVCNRYYIILYFIGSRNLQQYVQILLLYIGLNCIRVPTLAYSSEIIIIKIMRRMEEKRERIWWIILQFTGCRGINYYIIYILTTDSRVRQYDHFLHVFVLYSCYNLVHFDFKPQIRKKIFTTTLYSGEFKYYL